MFVEFGNLEAMYDSEKKNDLRKVLKVYEVEKYVLSCGRKERERDEYLEVKKG